MKKLLQKSSLIQAVDRLYLISKFNNEVSESVILITYFHKHNSPGGDFFFVLSHLMLHKNLE